MVASSVRRGLSCTFFTALMALGVAACGGVDEPIDDEQVSVDDSSGNVTATEEETSEAEQAMCGGWYPGAHCYALCCSHQNWNNLGPMAYGECTSAGKAHCAWAGGLCGACWD
jgi:hypothetical protein